MSFRLRKQTRLLCGHCNDYSCRAALWKHRRAYYDVDKECWITKDGPKHLEHEAKKPKDRLDHKFLEVMWSSGS